MTYSGKNINLCFSYFFTFLKISIYYIFFLILILVLKIDNIKAQSCESLPLFRFHFHNDYLRKKPLVEAIQIEASSIEIDVYKIKNQLYIAHLPTGIRPWKTLEKLYIQPLLSLIKDSTIIQKRKIKPLTILIDCKTNVSKIIPTLLKQLTPLQPYLTITYKSQKAVQQSLLQVIICHADPHYISSDSSFWLIDKHHVFTPIEEQERWKYGLLSYNWKKFFKWKGKKGEMKITEKQLLDKLLQNARLQKLPVRFYNAPDFPTFWKWCKDNNIDFIHTDKSLKKIKKHTIQNKL
ncbi:MAG: hypothetical protein RML72_05610 [Bacteroidia bacterium]|nr:hypothetical protein [Bacteroidia bacterium]MDW8158340.1 hypothetical protein [Bacteroidia bacterium]